MNQLLSNDGGTGTIHQKELPLACHKEHRETAPPGKDETFQHLLTEQEVGSDLQILPTQSLWELNLRTTGLKLADQWQARKFER